MIRRVKTEVNGTANPEESLFSTPFNHLISMINDLSTQSQSIHDLCGQDTSLGIK